MQAASNTMTVFDSVSTGACDFIIHCTHMASNESDGLLNTLIDHLLEVIIYSVLVCH